MQRRRLLRFHADSKESESAPSPVAPASNGTVQTATATIPVAGTSLSLHSGRWKVCLNSHAIALCENIYLPSTDKKKIEAFVKQGKGKLSKTTGPFKPIPVTTHELQASAPPDGTGVRFASRAAMSSVTLGDTRSSQVLSTLGPIEMEADIKDPAARR